MEQMITKEQIAEAAEQYAEQENSAWTNDYNGFAAGANFVLQNLQQTPCTTHVCPACGSQNLATAKRGFYALGVYFPTDTSGKKCLSCNQEFNSA